MRSPSLPAHAAALWAAIFAALHVVWALGWTVGLNEQQARMAFSNRWFLAYDLAVAAVCVYGVFVALSLAEPAARRMPPGLLRFSAWTGTILLVIRSGGSVLQALYLLAAGRFDAKRLGIWEPWFYLGAILFGVSTVRCARSRRAAGGR